MMTLAGKDYSSLTTLMNLASLNPFTTSLRPLRLHVSQMSFFQTLAPA